MVDKRKNDNLCLCRVELLKVFWLSFMLIMFIMLIMIIFPFLMHKTGIFNNVT